MAQSGAEKHKGSTNPTLLLLNVVHETFVYPRTHLMKLFGGLEHQEVDAHFKLLVRTSSK